MDKAVPQLPAPITLMDLFGIYSWLKLVI